MNFRIDEALPIALEILIIIILGSLALSMTSIFIKQIIKQTSKKNTFLIRATETLGGKNLINNTRADLRTKTIATFSKNVIKVIISATMVVFLMSTLGIPAQPFLASLGIISITIGFGAQTIIQDFVSGILITIEDQYGIGDEVQIGDLRGIIENVGLRVTTIKDAENVIWYIRNGEIKRLGNYSKKVL